MGGGSVLGVDRGSDSASGYYFDKADKESRKKIYFNSDGHFFYKDRKKCYFDSASGYSFDKADKEPRKKIYFNSEVIFQKRYVLDGALMATTNEFVFATGELIHAKYYNGPLWYGGVIESIHGDGTYDVRYNDGDSAHRVKPSLIRTAVRRKDDFPDTALPDPPLPDPPPPAEKKEKKKARQSPVEPPPVEPPTASGEGTSDINGASVADSAGGGGSVSDTDITNIF